MNQGFDPYFDYFPDDDDDDFQPDENSNDDDDDDMNGDLQNENGVKQPTLQSVLRSVLDRFNMHNQLSSNQIFISSLPKKEDLPNSPFTVDQWALLRHQCTLNFFLLCRSIRFTTYCASSDEILTGLFALLHTFNQIFKSSVETTKNINDLYQERLFVPVLGDPNKSFIPRADRIISMVANEGKSVDDLIEQDFFNEIFAAFPTKGIIKPTYIECHSPWTKEEDALLLCAHKRFDNAQDIQKFVIPGRSIQVIMQHMRDDWKSKDNSSMLPPKKRRDYKAQQAEEVEQQEYEEEDGDDELFEVDDKMKFNESFLPRTEPTLFYPQLGR